MTNDVKEAMERVRPHIGQLGNAPIADRNTLALAYLAENDDTEVTEGWLRSVGFEPFGEALMYSYSLGGLSAIGVHPTPITEARWTFSTRRDAVSNALQVADIPPKKTRGDVICLLAALGIPLKPAASEGGEG